ncbi:MAG: HU family DNA-binding protein [Desulfobacterales bacterium]|nr:HU family DNA-binding protein [Desulfobacterales bacterium]MBF0396558.1 HU family DNA-binding protein [Desulfobacterales bacterium]
MKKEELVKLVAEQTEVTQKVANKAIDSVIEGVAGALEKGEAIKFIGFGSFKVVKRKAREGINPQTKEKMKIPASKTVKFTPSDILKSKLQDKKPVKAKSKK